MDKQQGMAIVDGLRAAQAAGAPVVELQGDDARNCSFVTPESVVLGSFALLDGALMILVGSTNQQHGEQRSDDFQFRAYTRRNKVVLTTNKADAQGVVWGYSASLQDGKNAERRQAFRDAAGSDSIVIPYPVGDPKPFISAVPLRPDVVLELERDGRRELHVFDAKLRVMGAALVAATKGILPPPRQPLGGTSPTTS